jgi:hypothetical protein
MFVKKSVIKPKVLEPVTSRIGKGVAQLTLRKTE